MKRKFGTGGAGSRSVILLERVSGKYFKQILANQP